MSARVTDLVFREDDKYIALITDKPTMHVFKLSTESQIVEPSECDGIYEKIKGYVK